MTKLEQLIQELCPNGVENKPLEKCCNILDNKRKPITKSARETGEYPYYGANGIQDYVADYLFDGTFILVGEDGSVLTENGNPVVNWAEGKIWVNNHAHIVEECKGILLRYLFHYLQTINIAPLIHGNIPKLTGKDFRALQIPVPPLEVQAEIVRILDKFTELTTELTTELATELANRKKQFEYYRDKLLSMEEIHKKELHKCKLKEIAEIYDGTHQTPQYKEVGIPFISVENIGNIYSNSKFISKEAYNAYKIKPIVGDVFMTRIGSIGKCAIMTKQVNLAYYVSLALIRPNKEKLDSRYLKHYIESTAGTKELSKRTLHHAVPIKINKDDIGKIIVSYPSLSIQKRIADTLDRFDKLCNDISEGLPAEIEARQKQYEYYRDKLLQFAIRN